MSLTDKLLQLDSKKVMEKPVEMVAMKRFSDMAGEKIEFKCVALDGDTHSDIQKRGVDLGKKGNIRDIHMFAVKVHTLLEGVKEPSFKDPKLREQYGAATPTELVSKILLPGEIDELYKRISILSGFEADDDEDEIEDEIKN